LGAAAGLRRSKLPGKRAFGFPWGRFSAWFDPHSVRSITLDFDIVAPRRGSNAQAAAMSTARGFASGISRRTRNCRLVEA